ncbi:MAG: 3-oxoacyl-[acyl-carrier-protein] reductase [Candidatus Marinimicrobia bacterium]|nr:3-oxoacyl-[acyl-carrier-protein] reductase [Candidatus Neomarinimicrobiota bacterium]
MNKTNQVALITGSARGIGLEIAKSFYKDGAKIVICDINKELLAEVTKQFDPNRILALKCDVSDENEINRMITQVMDQFGRIDILVNNAGITRDNLILRMKIDEWDSVININLRSAFLMTQSVSKIMLRQRFGRIINITSVIGIIGNAGQSNYAASKSGLIGLTKSAAKELASRNITVNAIAPGYIQTDMTEKLTDNVKKTLLNQIPMRRLGNPSDLCGIIKFLTTKEAEYITGQTICVDGGMVM